MYIDNFIIYSYMILFYILILYIFEKSFIEKFIYNIKIIFLGESIIIYRFPSAEYFVKIYHKRNYMRFICIIEIKKTYNININFARVHSIA